jgi:hypothetical protein
MRGYPVKVSVFGELKILTVTTLYIFDILCFIIMNKRYTTQFSDIHSYYTIHKYNLYVQFCNTDHCKKSNQHGDKNIQ